MLDFHAPDPRIAAVRQLWQQFQLQLEQRFDEILAEVEHACATLLVEDADEAEAMSGAWVTAHARASDLATCLADAWNDQFGPRLRSLGADDDAITYARYELEALQDRMEVRLEHTRLRVFAEAARIRWVRALRDAPSGMSCPCCGARTPIPATFGPTEVGCPSCGTRMTYEPGPRVRMLERGCVHALCEEASWEPWLAMRQAERTLHAAPHETLELLQAYEHAQIVYWHTYLQARVALLPHTAQSFTVDLRNQLQPWYLHVEHRAAWARAGRPRALS